MYVVWCGCYAYVRHALRISCIAYQVPCQPNMQHKQTHLQDSVPFVDVCLGVQRLHCPALHVPFTSVWALQHSFRALCRFKHRIGLRLACHPCKCRVSLINSTSVKCRCQDACIVCAQMCS